MPVLEDRRPFCDSGFMVDHTGISHCQAEAVPFQVPGLSEDIIYAFKDGLQSFLFGHRVQVHPATGLSDYRIRGIHRNDIESLYGIGDGNAIACLRVQYQPVFPARAFRIGECRFDQQFLLE